MPVFETPSADAHCALPTVRPDRERRECHEHRLAASPDRIQLVTDRSKSPTRKLQLGEAEPLDVAHLTSRERVEMVEEVTKQAWTFEDGNWDGSRIRRDVVRTIRGQS